MLAGIVVQKNSRQFLVRFTKEVFYIKFIEKDAPAADIFQNSCRWPILDLIFIDKDITHKAFFENITLILWFRKEFFLRLEESHAHPKVIVPAKLVKISAIPLIDVCKKRFWKIIGNAQALPQMYSLNLQEILAGMFFKIL